jgi:hypothetical protein
MDAELAKLKQVLTKELPKLNELLSRKKVPGVFADELRKGK